MPWWGWIVVGAVLLGAELLAIPADFYLVFMGAAALAVGFVGFLGIDLPVWGQWALFGVLAAGSLVAFRSRLQRRRRPDDAPSRVDDTLVGELGAALEAIAAGGVGRVELRGSPWKARNLEPAPLEPGAAVRVERVEGLVLSVRRAP